MHFSPSQALFGLLATLIPSALAAPTEIIDDTLDIYSRDSTTDTTPNLVARQIFVPKNRACYNKMKGCQYKDVYMEKAKQYATEICDTFAGVWGKPGWPGAYNYIVNQYWVGYYIRVDWVPGCEAPGDGTMDIHVPGPGATCLELVFSSWRNCNNGGRGGSVDYGCLSYHYNIINGNEAGHEYCVNIPFDNATLIA